jgi:hypothetical protein
MLISPLLVSFKVLFSEIIKSHPNLGWHDQVPEKFKNEFTSHVEEVLQTQQLVFN